ncbi:class I tRNA ligase family protein [bacterium]|nr:class I tRNA ligase family protein [bacterium]
MDIQENSKSDVARREEEMLAFWQEHDIFNKSLKKDSPEGDFVFYDGPPFATGLPHYGHILAGTMKDAIPRFWTMNGYHVRRKWGWDCHGLPVENLIEKKLGLATKRDIEEHGVKEFNEAARDTVMEFADDWRKIIPRMGRFVDMEDDYKTMDSNYTESVWWVFSELYKKGLVYEGFKSMHLCPRCGTTLSNFEVNQGYADIKDIAVTVRLPLVEEPNVSLLVWTTTPWTLPGNMGVAINNEHEYVQVKVTTEEGEDEVILAKERLIQLGTDAYEIVREMKGTELVGKSYVPPFNYFEHEDIKNKENAWKVHHADYVEIGEEGTGLVHLAPAYGDDDILVAQENNIPIVHHVGEDGRFLPVVTDFAGKLVKPKDDDDAGVTHLEADIEIVKALNAANKLYRKENITHSYPHCWRCDTPLLNYATNSWFVEVTKIKDELVEENNKVTWVPEHVGVSRFGKWLEGARDWAISRQRYWGAPIPIWRNPETNEVKVFGSLADLREYVPRSENTYFLMRHGEAESNVKNTPSTDINEENPMTERGHTQVLDAVTGLKEKEIDLIIASPFQRTRETAEIVRKGLGLKEDAVIFDERIGEIAVGEFNGRPIPEYHAFLDENSDWCTAEPEGGESWCGVKRRVGAFLYDIDANYKDKKILIIGHNSPLRMFGAVNDGLSLEGSEFDHDADGRRYENAEVRELPFIPMPHNDEFELDFHRPYIDEITLIDTDGTKLERIPDVFDCWFESGSMPYAETHYPFENLDVTDPPKDVRFPADFIAEGLDQTRGWFYSLLVLGTALFGKSPYQNVIVNGLVLAEDGKKMSKSLQNYPDPMELADRVGVDAMRFYMLSSPIVRSEDLSFSEKGVAELQRKNIGRLHNVLAMYEQYASAEVTANASSTHVLDQWIIARLNELTEEVTEGFQKYELDRATRPVTDFIDDLSVWYLRRSRDRLKGEDIEDKNAALGTLRHVLATLSKVIAPSMPFYAEYLYQAVKGGDEPESVHLTDWPAIETAPKEVLDAMVEVRRIVSEALEVRAKAGVKVRQPLSTLTVKADDENAIENEGLIALIEDELNVKEVVFDASLGDSVSLNLEITPELKAEGNVREFIRYVQQSRKEKGLNPDDRITLAVDEKTEDLIASFKDEVQSVVGAVEIVTGVTENMLVATIDDSEYHYEIRV